MFRKGAPSCSQVTLILVENAAKTSCRCTILVVSLHSFFFSFSLSSATKSVCNVSKGSAQLLFSYINLSTKWGLGVVTVYGLWADALQDGSTRLTNWYICRFLVINNLKNLKFFQCKYQLLDFILFKYLIPNDRSCCLGPAQTQLPSWLSLTWLLCRHMLTCGIVDESIIMLVKINKL